MREEISAYKRERILEEAVKLFYERGFSGTTLDDIAGKLGVTKPFIYTHFRSKVELLEAICRPTIEMSLAAIADAAAAARQRRRSGCSTAIVKFTKVVLQRQANIAVYFREEKNLSEAGLAEINALRKRFDRVLSDLLEEGASAASSRSPTSASPRWRSAAWLVAAYTWYQPGGRLSIDDVGAHMARFAIGMVGVQAAEAALFDLEAVCDPDRACRRCR